MSNYFHPTVQIAPLADIEVSTAGTDTHIDEYSKIDSFVKIKHVGGRGDIRIGKNVYLNSGTVLYSGNGIQIGDNVLIGPNCSFVPVNHNYHDLNRPICMQGFLPSKGGIVIESNVWIGANVTILDGAVIPTGSIIGANSLVKDVLMPWIIYAGNPLREIGKRE